MAPPAAQPVARPLFAQIEDLIVARITAGEWKPGEPLPSENEFADFYNVSQGTVRKAIAQMAADNLVIRFRGKGTFLASQTIERERSHFFHILRDDGIKEQPKSVLISASRRRANREIAGRLAIEPGSMVAVVERMKVIGDAPRVFETVIVADSTFPNLCEAVAEELPSELYPHYETAYGVRVVRAEERLKAVAATARDAELLQVGPGSPLLEIDRLAMTYGDVPVEWRRDRCNTESHFYQSSLR